MPTPFNPREILAAAPDAIAIGAGAKPDRHHPLANELSLRNIAYACGILSRKQLDFESDISVMGRGMGTADFSRSLAAGLQPGTIASYTAQAEHMNFVATQEVSNFMPVDIRALEADVDLEPLAESAEIQAFSAVLSGGAREVRLTTYARSITIGRAAIINNQVADVGRLFGSIGFSAARLEARMVAAAMEENQVLDDGDVVFDAKYSNVLGDAENPAPLLPSNLGLAMSLLRTQPTASGQRADLRAKHLVVEPALELSARQFVRDAGLDVTVSVLANLPAGRWYLLADQAACPTVGVLRLLGAKTPVRVEQRMPKIAVDGSCVTVTADLGAFMLRRTGIVRAG